MDIISILGIVIIVALVVTKFQARNERLRDEPVVIKRCPAHNWEWKEQPGMENMYYIQCNWCGKIPGQLGETLD
jgi:hypothetical protein